jgi:hypothetical protein
MLMPAVNAEPPDDNSRPGQARWRPRPVWVALGTVTALAADAITQRYDPALGVAMFVCDAGIPVVLTMVVVAVALFGGGDRTDRAFRLLRWIRDKPEPPGPLEPPARSRAPGRKAHRRSGRRAGRRPRAYRTRRRGGGR